MSAASKHPGTVALHAGERADPATGAVAVPIYRTTSYQFRIPSTPLNAPGKLAKAA